MEKNTKQTIKKAILTSRPLFITLVLTAVILIMSVAGVISYAAYTNSRNAQRTIATYDSTGDRFSSNLLSKLPSYQNVKTLYVTYDPEHPEDTPDPTTVVTVCNYQQGKQTLPFDENIEYTLFVHLVHYDYEAIGDNRYIEVDSSYMADKTAYSVSVKKGGEVSAVALNSGNGWKHTFSDTLIGGTTDSDAYTITLSSSFALNNPDLYLELIATPNVDLPRLCGIIKADRRSQGANNRWQGEFTDDMASSPSTYDGFNYRISGVGSGTFTIRWDGTKVSLSALSLIQLMSIDGAVQDGNSITFPVNSDEVNRYDLQFYKINITSETWTQMRTSVVTYGW